MKKPKTHRKRDVALPSRIRKAGFVPSCTCQMLSDLGPTRHVKEKTPNPTTTEHPHVRSHPGDLGRNLPRPSPIEQPQTFFFSLSIERRRQGEDFPHIAFLLVAAVWSFHSGKGGGGHVRMPVPDCRVLRLMTPLETL